MLKGWHAAIPSAPARCLRFGIDSGYPRTLEEVAKCSTLRASVCAK